MLEDIQTRWEAILQNYRHKSHVALAKSRHASQWNGMGDTDFRKHGHCIKASQVVVLITAILVCNDLIG